MFKSPFVDHGHDIADYYTVDPIFGTDEDMDELIAEAKKREIYIVLTWLSTIARISISGSMRPCRSQSPYRDYFYFVDSPDGPPSK